MCVDFMARESATRARATMGDANGKKIPARAREMILTCAARVILSGHDGVTAREVADVMRRTTCERTKRALVGEDGTNHAREESAFETLRDASAAEADARGGGGSGWTRRGEGGARDVVFDLAGREYRPPRSWLGASRGGGKTKERRRRTPHASVRDVLRMCRAAADEQEGEGGTRKGRVFVDAASPEKRSMARVNPLLELEAKDRARAEAKKNKGKKNKKAAAKDAAPKKRKRRDLANEKAGNHLAIMSWIGEGKKDKVRRDRTFYDGFSREGVEYKTGDCVYCLPERTTEEMYVAQIQRCFEDEDESMMIECCWFMTQAEVLAWGGELPPSTHPNEIFLGTSVDVNPIDALEGIAPVSTHADFIASDPSSSSSKTTKDERRLFARKCYVPAHGYDPKSKRQSKRKTGAFHPLHHVPGRGFVIQWPSSKKTKKGKR